MLVQRLLAARLGQLVAREELLGALASAGKATSQRSLDTLVYRLRKKLPALADGRPALQTVRGRGYVLMEDAPPTPDFVGRAPTVRTLRALLERGSVVLWGPPGQGKRTVARQVWPEVPLHTVGEMRADRAIFVAELADVERLNRWVEDGARLLICARTPLPILGARQRCLPPLSDAAARRLFLCAFADATDQPPPEAAAVEVVVERSHGNPVLLLDQAWEAAGARCDLRDHGWGWPSWRAALDAVPEPKRGILRLVSGASEGVPTTFVEQWAPGSADAGWTFEVDGVTRPLPWLERAGGRPAKDILAALAEYYEADIVIAPELAPPATRSLMEHCLRFCEEPSVRATLTMAFCRAQLTDRIAPFERGEELLTEVLRGSLPAELRAAAHYHRATLRLWYEEAGSWEDLEEADRLARGPRLRARIYQRFAGVHWRARRYPEAEEALRAVPIPEGPLDEIHVAVLSFLAEIVYLQERPEEALEILRGLNAQGQVGWQAHSVHCRIACGTGRAVEARMAWHRFRESSMAPGKAERHGVAYQNGQVAILEGRWAPAAEALSKAAEGYLACGDRRGHSARETLAVALWLGGETRARCVEILTEAMSGLDALDDENRCRLLTWFRDGEPPAPTSFGWTGQVLRLISTNRPLPKAHS